MAFVFMGLVYCNYAISHTFCLLVPLIRVFLKMCKWTHSAMTHWN